MKKSFNSLTFFIGIDVSKLTLNITVLIPSLSKKKYKRVGNSTAGMKELNLWLRKIEGFKYPYAMFCMEHTGVYTRLLLSYLSEKSANMESSLMIKKSLGLKRGRTAGERLTR